jgi:hypothetical protein
MGIDENTSSGAEPAISRFEDEPVNVKRGAGYILAADAKSINPGVKVSLLRWGEITWVKKAGFTNSGPTSVNAAAYEAAYQWYKKTIVACYEEFGYMIDFVCPDRNENSNMNDAWCAWYARRLKSDSDPAGFPASWGKAQIAAYNSIRLNLAEQNNVTNSAQELIQNTGSRGILADGLVDAVSFHYRTNDSEGATNGRGLGNPDPDGAGYYKRLYGDYNMDVWYSEGVATQTYGQNRLNATEVVNGSWSTPMAGRGIGGFASVFDISTRIIQGFYESRRTHYIFQPAIGAFHTGAKYAQKEILTAHDPWSGIWFADVGLVGVQHFTQFAKVGWLDKVSIDPETGEVTRLVADETAGDADDGRNNPGKYLGGDDDIWRVVFGATKSLVPEETTNGTTVSNQENHDGSGGEENYMTLAAPDKTDWSSVIVNDSLYAKQYTIRVRDMAPGVAAKPVYVWETRGPDDPFGEGYDPLEDYDENYKRKVATLQPAVEDGVATYVWQMKPESMVTVTTLDRGEEYAYERMGHNVEEFAALDHGTALDSLLYSDDFEYAGAAGVNEEGTPYATLANDPKYWPGDADGAGDGGASYKSGRGDLPRYISTGGGAFELDGETFADDPLHGQALTQLVTSANNWGAVDLRPQGWGSYTAYPTTRIGDHLWANYKASVDVSFLHQGSGNGTGAARGYAEIAIRDQWNDNVNSTSTPYRARLNSGGSFLVYDGSAAVYEYRIGEGVAVTPGAGSDELPGSLAPWDSPVAAGGSYDFTAWQNIGIGGAGNVISAYLNGTLMHSFADTSSPALSGRIDLGSNWSVTYFDNLKVEAMPGYVPTLRARTYALSMEVRYAGNWARRVRGGADTWERGQAIAGATPAGQESSITFPFNGTGFDLVGVNGVAAAFDVYIDGLPYASKAPARSSASRVASFGVHGLPDGEHVAKLVLGSGTGYSFEAIEAYGAPLPLAEGDPLLAEALEKLGAAYEARKNAERGSASDIKWATFAGRLGAIKSILDGDAPIDLAEVDGTIEALEAAYAGLRAPDSIAVLTAQPIVAYLPDGRNLPRTILAEIDGVEKAVLVDWDEASVLSAVSRPGPRGASGADPSGYAFPAVTGRLPDYGNAAFDVAVLPVPEGLAYFVDVKGAAYPQTYDYLSIMEAAAATVRNGTNDQPWDEGGAAGSRWGYRPTSERSFTGTGTNMWTTVLYTSNTRTSGNHLSYNFDLPAGKWDVYVGLYEPWSNASRQSRVTINDAVVQDNILYGATGNTQVLRYQGVETAGGDAPLRFRMDYGSSNGNQSPHFAWLMIAPAPEPASKPALSAAPVEGGALLAEFANGAGADMDVALIAAVYDGAGKLARVESAAANVAAGAELARVFGIDAARYAGHSYKVFAWDGATFAPLAEPASGAF